MHIHQEQSLQLLEVWCLKAALEKKKMQICQKKKNLLLQIYPHTSLFSPPSWSRFLFGDWHIFESQLRGEHNAHLLSYCSPADCPLDPQRSHSLCELTETERERGLDRRARCAGGNHQKCAKWPNQQSEKQGLYGREGKKKEQKKRSLGESFFIQ